MDIKDLIERLRNHPKDQVGHLVLCRECEAADALERLQAEMDQLKDDLFGEQVLSRWRYLELEKLQAERDAYREVAVSFALGNSLVKKIRDACPMVDAEAKRIMEKDK